MASFSRLFSSSYRSLPAFVRRIFNINEQNENGRSFLSSLVGRFVNITETDDSMIWRFNLVTGDVRKEEVDVCVDHNILKLRDLIPRRNRFTGTFDLTGKNYDAVNITAKLENDVLQIVIPKLKKKEEGGEEENVDFIIHHRVVVD